MKYDKLSDAYGHHNGEGYRVPNELALSDPGLRRLLVVGGCQAMIWEVLPEHPVKCPVDYVLFNHTAELPDSPPKPIEDYDLQILQIPLRAVLYDFAYWSFSPNDLNAASKLFDESCNRISLFLEFNMKWNKIHGIMTIVSNFFVPQQNPFGRLMPRYKLTNWVYFIERLNEFLGNKLEKYKNTYILDIDQISSTLGRAYIQDDAVAWSAHSSFMPGIPADNSRIIPSGEISEYYKTTVFEAIASIWAEIIGIWRSVRQLDPVKLVVFDLDDTLWRGVIGDMDEFSEDVIEGYIWPMGILDAAQFLKARGILLAIISKNEEEKIRKIWPETVGYRFSLDDFAIIKINRRTKAENMEDILKVTNLLPRSVVFVDDSHVERAGMAAAFPEIRTLGGHHLYWRRMLLWSPETQNAVVTEESVSRTSMMQQQVKREELRTAMSRSDFLQSLGLKVILYQITDQNGGRYSRAFELLNKTNQFNTTGKRWSAQEIEGFCQEGQMNVFDVEDSLSNYGLVGVVLCRAGKIEQFVMSCRVAGLEVELAVLYSIVKSIRHTSAVVIETKDNFMCRDVYERAGFVERESMWHLDGEPMPAPEHIQLDVRPA